MEGQTHNHTKKQDMDEEMKTYEEIVEQQQKKTGNIGKHDF